jgi:ribosomal-protein-alanine N-acetyltransferase
MIAWMIGRIARFLPCRKPMITAATVADAGAIAVLHGQSFRRGWSQQEIESLLLDRAVVAHRALHRRRCAGFILSRRAGDEAEILSVAVAQKHRGRGLGRDMLTLHLRRLAGHGIRTVFLEVDETNTPATRLYRRTGFKEVGRRHNYYSEPDGSSAHALVLRRDLA